MTLTKNMTAKLSKQKDGRYFWRADGANRTPNVWEITKQKGRPRYSYMVRNDHMGLYFTADTLKEVQVRLPKVDATYLVDETLLEGVYKTEAREEADMKARSEAEKLAAADKTIVEGLEGRLAEAQVTHDKFIKEVNETVVGGLPHAIKWCGEAVLQSYLAQTIRHMLAVERAEDRKSLIINRHERLLGELLSGTLYQANSSNSFHRAAESEQRTAMHQLFRMLNHYLAIYHEEYVSDVPEPVTGTWYYN